MFRFLSASLVVIGLAGLPVSAPMANPDLYLGGGLGYYRLKDDSGFQNTQDEEFKDDRIAWQVFGGSRLGPFFGVEAGYNDFGTARDNGARTEIDGWNIAATAQLPMIPIITPYAKAGQLFWDRETRFVGGASSSDSSSNPYVGLGVRVSLLPGLGLRIDYDRFKVDDSRIDRATVNLQFGF